MRKHISKPIALLGSVVFAALIAQGGGPWGPRALSAHMPSNSPVAGPLLSGTSPQYDLVEIVGPSGSSNLQAEDINNRGTVVGCYALSNGETRTFFFEDGVFRDLAHPGSTVTCMSETNSGLVYGNWGATDQQTAGFYDAETGQWAALPDVPNKAMNYFWRVNDAGLGVGDACEGLFGFPFNCVGWTWNDKTRGYQFSSYPGASSTMPLGINNRRQTVGIAVLSDVFYGYLEYKGDFKLLTGDRPSIAWDVNEVGEVVLTYLDTGENALLDRRGIQPLPRSPDPAAVGTTYQGMNDRGDLAGNWIDITGSAHAFMAIRKNE
jgi:probable HAF family extracellular repeat protein